MVEAFYCDYVDACDDLAIVAPMSFEPRFIVSSLGRACTIEGQKILG
jgi:hypothetical protein